MKKSILVIIIASIICLPVYSATKDNTQKREVDEKGYMGTLPDITDKYDKSRTSISTPVFEAQEGFTDPNELKPIPTENPAFINVILKKDKTSKYLNDLNEVIPMLEKVLTSIENEDNVQVFMSKALTLGLNVDYIRDKYEGKPESYYESFRRLMEVNLHTQTVATMRAEASIYSKYLAYSSTGSIYNPQNISRQLEYLKDEIISALICLKQQE